MTNFTLKNFTVIAVVFGIWQNGCAKMASNQHEPVVLSKDLTVDVSGGQVDFAVEIADTEQKRARGLMGRKYLAPNTGMFFIFETSDRHIFWMKNTFIALDLIFYDDAFKVVGFIENAIPHSERFLDIGKNSRYVLEVGAGTVNKYGITIGSSARLK